MNRERLYQILLSPHVSEKSTLGADVENRFVFKVATHATKPEIKEAVEFLFEVNVTDVSVINIKGKRKRQGAHGGRRSDWKKAYIRLAEGQDIDFVGGE